MCVPWGITCLYIRGEVYFTILQYSIHYSHSIIKFCKFFCMEDPFVPTMIVRTYHLFLWFVCIKCYKSIREPFPLSHNSWIFSENLKHSFKSVFFLLNETQDGTKVYMLMKSKFLFVFGPDGIANQKMDGEFVLLYRNFSVYDPTREKEKGGREEGRKSTISVEFLAFS